ncbi:hypothetical protein CI102_5389 [Trichoderma harzianum]|nr:hypothetical protein CI102_5389 [Trichoderma harzianum]
MWLWLLLEREEQGKPKHRHRHRHRHKHLPMGKLVGAYSSRRSSWSLLKSRRRNATQTVQAVPLAASHVAFLRQMLCVNLTFRASTSSSEFGLSLPANFGARSRLRILQPFLFPRDRLRLHNLGIWIRLCGWRGTEG